MGEEVSKSCFGCTLLIALCLVGAGYSLYDSCQEKKAEEATRVARQQKDQEKKDAARTKHDKVRDFALKEMPDSWRKFEQTLVDVEAQKAAVEKIKTALVEFDRDYKQDEAYLRERQKLDEISKSRDEQWYSLQTAYLDSIKFQSATGAGDHNESVERAKRGTEEASGISEQYREMLNEK